MNDGVDAATMPASPVGAFSGESELPAELDTGLGGCQHFLGGSEFDEPLRLRRIKERYPESYAELAESLRAVVRGQVGTILRQKFSPTKKYISQVLSVRDDGHRKRVLRTLRDGLVAYPGQLFIWTDEGDHIHVIHDCPNSNGQCRCRVLKGEDFRFNVRSSLRRSKFISELDEIDWINVLLYFLVSKWPCQSQIWIGGRLQGPTDFDQVVRWKCLQGKCREVLAGEDEGNGHHGIEQQPNLQDGRIIVPENPGPSREKRSAPAGPTGVAPKKQRLSKFERISQTVATLLGQVYCIPASNVRDIFAHDPVSDCLYDPTADKFVVAASQLFTQRMNHLTFNDFKDLYSNGCPVFYANSKDPFEYYHDREYSKQIIIRLLQFQFKDDEEEIKKFLVNIRDWFNKKGWDGNPKCNAITILGPPNSGKNYFFDMIASIAFNVGHIGRVNNKTNNFALQECYGRRMVVGNEISMEEGALEDFKKLCEGTAFNIRVKFQGDKIFTKAPVLLISNGMLQITGHVHFENIRNKTMRWRTADLLKESTMKPYPLCIFDVYEHFEINVS